MSHDLKTKEDELRETHHARFELHPAVTEEYIPGLNGQKPTPMYRTKQTFEFLDELMDQIPGRDGYDAVLEDETPEPRDTAAEIIG